MPEIHWTTYRKGIGRSGVLPWIASISPPRAATSGRKRQVRTISTRGVIAQSEVRHVDHREWPNNSSHQMATAWRAVHRRPGNRRSRPVLRTGGSAARWRGGPTSSWCFAFLPSSIISAGPTPLSHREPRDRPRHHPLVDSDLPDRHRTDRPHRRKPITRGDRHPAGVRAAGQCAGVRAVPRARGAPGDRCQGGRHHGQSDSCLFIHPRRHGDAAAVEPHPVRAPNDPLQRPPRTVDARTRHQRPAQGRAHSEDGGETSCCQSSSI